VYPSEIVAAGTRHDDGRGQPIRVGDRIEITGLVADAEGRPVGRRDDATIAADPGPAAGDVSGEVLRLRPDSVLRRLGEAIDGLREGDDVIEAPGVIAAHPYAALWPVLFADRLPAVRCRIHGDLNARNILLVDSPHGQTPPDRPYLIDYARAEVE